MSQDAKRIEGMDDSGTEASGLPGRLDQEGVLEAVVAEHQAALLRYAGRMLNDAAAAQDVVQEAFVRLYRSWTRGLKLNGQLTHWLYRTTHNAAVDWIRRESRLRVLHEAHAQERETLAADPDEAARDTERKQLALAHLSKLKPSERQVLILRLQEGLSYREIARITGRSEGNVGCLLHHAVRKLHQRLQKAGVIE